MPQGKLQSHSIPGATCPRESYKATSETINSNFTQRSFRCVLLFQLLAAKEGDPSRFQSFWEMDEEGVDEESMEEIQSKIAP